MKYQLAILITLVQWGAAYIDYIPPSMAKPLVSGNVRSGSGLSGSRVVLSKKDQLVVFPAVELALPQPVGFEQATSFHGFQQSSTSSSVMMTVIPGSFKEVTRGFDQKGLATRGISLLSRQTIKIQKQPGFLLHVAQSAAGSKFLKWIVVFGDDQKTNIVTATFLSENAAKLSAPLKKVVLSVTPSQRAISANVLALPFAVTAVKGMNLVKKLTGIGKVAVFTKDGNMPIGSPADPLFLIAPSLGEVSVGDEKMFATRRLSNYPQADIVTMKSSQPITIDNLSGWEIVADALDRKTKTPLKIYQVMLFSKQGGYVVMTGLVGDQQAERYMPKFKAIALTYKNLVK